ncbi:MAG: hypothetical protein KatS3mg115_1493 [Candidatus Poribacteria bacterium]|nr:MAG: hypothetical protein KatS3mg115_1493 [Candidatus Poribacteria bacterium]
MPKDQVRLLLVEDMISDARLIQTWLDEIPEMEFEVVHVTRLADAQEQLRTGRFDVVLLDLMLPDAEQEETIRGIRAVSPKTPVVVLTGLRDERVLAEMMEMGAQDYLLKDYVNDRLLAHAIRFSIERQRVINERFVQVGEAVEMVSRRQVTLQGVNLSHWDLSAIPLERAYLKDVDFSHCILRQANLRQAVIEASNLEGANLERADLQWAKLSETSLVGANLSRAALRWSVLENVNLSGAHLTDAQLQGADLSQARLDNALLKGARYNDETRLPEGLDPHEQGMIREG